MFFLMKMPISIVWGPCYFPNPAQFAQRIAQGFVVGIFFFDGAQGAASNVLLWLAVALQAGGHAEENRLVVKRLPIVAIEEQAVVLSGLHTLQARPGGFVRRGAQRVARVAVPVAQPLYAHMVRA